MTITSARLVRSSLRQYRDAASLADPASKLMEEHACHITP
jgi:hypothetical protein